ncbi:PREDICTED: F-box protein At2g35280-like [Camelina sativa]|uniref:F-box protein At2g35280-like n=1 Tax=Camelina sativa TaxID=90675 RepID=A0ABM1R6C0_CAMSA|nr:PREDICTED: F-box protein At2g35280-like [Camelina sativa]
MSPSKELSPLESLPQYLLGEIISRVAKSGRNHVRHCFQVSHELAIACKDERVSKELNLKQLAMNPLATVHNYQRLMEKCLQNGNAEAHYIEGVKQYFYHNNTPSGLHHLQASAEGLYEKGIYLYGILMLCRGETDTGKQYLDKLQWVKSTTRSDRCWTNIKLSLQGIHIIMQPSYFQSIRDIKPNKICTLNDMDTRCKKCYYYKQMRKFVNRI